MQNENDLIQKLMISKQIMQKHKEMPRGQSSGLATTIPNVESYETPNSRFDIPQEYLQEGVNQTQTPKTPQASTKHKIMSSKLPDEIKMLMIEHPIQQPNNMAGPSISNDLVEKASRLMNVNAKGDVIKETRKTTQTSNPSNVDSKMLKELVRETMEEILRENGLLVESTSKTNEVFTFRVGEHIFEGKLTKIKKISK
jgi:hypothetical protein